MNQLQDPKHIVPSTIVGLLLSSGWEVALNIDGDPYIRSTTRPYVTYSTWWQCLSDVIELASDPENMIGN